MIKSVHVKSVVCDIVVDPPENSRVGLIFSGGIDSTLILILLNRLRKQRNLQITTFTIENICGYDEHVLKILSDPQFFGIKAVTRIDNNRDFSGYIDGTIEKILARDDLDIIYTGVNAVPEALMTYPHPPRPNFERVAEFKKLRCPLLNLTKDFVVAAYLQILDAEERRLFSLTRSCTDPDRNNCGQCYQCIEKEWALEQVGVSAMDCFD